MSSLLHLSTADNIAIARQNLCEGEAPEGIFILEEIPAGHKVAVQPIATGETVLRYGQPIGQATQAILPGSWVHTHNLALGESNHTRPWTVVPALTAGPALDTFLGYRRADGKVGTRNYIAVVAMVNCAAHTAVRIARAFTPQRLSGYPNVDGVIAIVPPSGCSIPSGGLSHRYLQRIMINLTHHPNIAALLFISLGCEVNQLEACNCAADELMGAVNPAGQCLVIQELGGSQKTVEKGIAAVERLLPAANAIRRTPQPVSDLTVALQCGGSDGWSGVTANPLVGAVADRLVQQGGTAVLAETPEIYGAEHLLARRVTRNDVGHKLAERLAWWEQMAERLDFSLDNNPSPGNKAGGLTTIYEKSLGAVAKGGTTPLNGVYEYAEWIERRGLVFMDTPGNDPVSVTGELAGGCNLILFTTGRGTPYGSNMAPCVKVASNSRLFQIMPDDMDFNAGLILEGISIDQAAQRLWELVLAFASGEKTCSERHGLPEIEFVPWQPDAVL